MHEGDFVMESDVSFRLLETDALYLCGTNNAINRYYDEFSSSRL